MQRRTSIDWRYSSLAVMLIAPWILSGCGGGGGNGGGGGDSQPAAPTVSLTAPSGGSVNRTVQLTANATAGSGVNRVEFLVDGNVIATDTTAPYSTDWDTSTVADGAHSVTARVVDAANVSATSAAATVNVLNSPTINVAVSSAEVFPSTNSTATGTGQLTFNLVTGVVTGGVTLSGITATLAHIHHGIAGTNGPVIVDFLASAADPNRWEVETGDVLNADQVNALLAGQLYVNVHSAAHPGGEIRGQIKPQGVVVGIAGLSGANVAPPQTNTATGFAAMTINESSNTATVHVQTTGVDDATEAHVHNAPAGENAAAPLLTLMKDPAVASHWLLEQQSITQAERDALAADRLYVDVHTPASPGGALRGQLSTEAEAPAAVTLTQLQTTIFTPSCAGCHTGGGSSLPASMNLSNAAATHAAIVGVASTEQPSLQRVTPGNPDASYLVRKIEGGPSITGARMPLGGAPLDAALIADVRAWITAGAANN
ncbi:CHRD domain-containing protein [Steroidobacter sp. S1-65]|uniref:CHRD domain-containing protein n=2 Tax=Steroidobacter gossypii TaxID=2805490 RepID=A0ABS1WUL9_9GAMM|nr:CHRD domain-containing protein [Steroidobacter gossypii]